MKDKNKKPAKVSKSEFMLTLFVTFFFRSFIFLFIPGLIFIIVGIFRNECLIIGAVLLAIDLIISLYFTIKASRLKGSHEIFNAIVQAADEDSDDDLNELNTKPNKEDLYSERAHELRRTASDAKSVRDVFELYKKDIADMALTDETCTVYIKKEKYFFLSLNHRTVTVPSSSSPTISFISACLNSNMFHSSRFTVAISLVGQNAHNCSFVIFPING